MLSRIAAANLLAALSIAGSAIAETYTVSPQSDWFSRLNGSELRPGDELVLVAGVYSDRRRLVVGHRGTIEQPIIVRAAEGERVVLRRPDAKQNSINLQGCQHFVIRGIEITGGSSAIRIGPDSEGRQSSDIVLEDLHIHHIGGVAITCNEEGGDYRRMRFQRNHIHHTSGHGEAFYLGANQAKATFSASFVENNYIHHLNGPKISQGDGIEVKHGSFGNRIAGNIIHDTRYPGITVYGTRGRDRNVIEANLIWNTGDHGIQAAADAIIRGNWIANAGGCGIYSREHQGAVPGNLLIDDNHIVAIKNPAIRIIGAELGNRREQASIELSNNRLVAENQLALRVDNGLQLRATSNRGSGRVQGSESFLAAWQETKPEPIQLPRFEGNPAWQSLPRETVEDALNW